MQILVTGSDGFLGSHITDLLLKKNYKVKALFHPGSSAVSELPEKDGFSVVNGSLMDKESLKKALSGVSAVIHTAASTMVFPPKNKIIWDINYQGTINLAEAAQKSGIEKFIHIGTANSFVPGTIDNPGNEEKINPPGTSPLDYIESKKAAQIFLMDLHKKTGFPVVVINPTYMLGPGDRKPGSGIMLLRIYGKKIIPVTSGGKNYIYVKDVAAAAVSALEKGKDGQAYICGNKNMTYSEALPLFAEIINEKKVKKISMPAAFILFFGLTNNVYSKLTGKTPWVSYTMTRLSLKDYYYSAEKAVKELDLPQTPLENAVKEAINWFKENGYVNE